MEDGSASGSPNGEGALLNDNVFHEQCQSMLSLPVSSLLFSALLFFPFLSHLSFCNPSISVLEAGSIVIAFGDISATMIYEGSDNGDWTLSYRAEKQGIGFQDCILQWGMAIGCACAWTHSMCCATGYRPPQSCSVVA